MRWTRNGPGPSTARNPAYTNLPQSIAVWKKQSSTQQKFS